MFDEEPRDLIKMKVEKNIKEEVASAEAVQVSTFKLKTLELAEDFEKLTFKRQSELSGKVLRLFKVIMNNLNLEKWAMLAKSIFSCTDNIISKSLNLPAVKKIQVEESETETKKPGDSTKPQKKLKKQSLRLLGKTLLGVYLIKDKPVLAAEILSELLFTKTDGLDERSELEELSGYVLYKYLIIPANEVSRGFLMGKLREYQSRQANSLVGIIYNHLLRQMLVGNQIEEAGRFLMNCDFPEFEQNIQLCKFLFHKGFYMGLVGDFAQARLFLGQALQKAPEDQFKTESRALKNFKLLTQKHLIVVSLLMSEMPSPKLFQNQRLNVYKQLVLLVSKGHFQEFRSHLELNKEIFNRDYVLPLLLKLKSVVLKNGLKKLSQAYSSLSVAELLNKLGLHQENKLQVNAFLAKVMAKMNKFVLNSKDNTVVFKREERDMSDDSVRETLVRRIEHVKSLEEQMVKALKFSEQNVDLKEDVGSADEFDLDELDFSFDDML